jgi:type III restriction enzyme
MNRHVNAIAGRLSLRAPQRRSLEILDRVTELVPPKKNADVAAALEAIRREFPSVVDFEREFPSICFALATGVGKTRLMGAFVSYLYLAHGLNNFFVLAPNLTIYNKLIADFTPNTPKYVFKGIAEFATEPPHVVTGDSYEQVAALPLAAFAQCTVNIFNIAKISSEVRGGKAPRIKRLSEYIGESYFDYLAGLPDLVLIMDESHRYRASAGVRAINELKPVLGLELTATPLVETSRGAIPFKNVIYDYALGQAMEEGFVKEPAVVTRKDFNPSGVSTDEVEKMKLEDGVQMHEATKVELATYARQADSAVVKPFVLVIARDTVHAGQLMQLIQSERFFEGRYKDKVIQVDSSKTGADEEEMIGRLLKVEHADEPTEIVIHVNMLKEGWDVTNLYTIVPLRAANARVLIEQSIGRGLRLPYGKRTGVEAVDTLSIVAHDRFQEIIDEAKKPGSAIRLKTIVLDPATLGQATMTVVSVPNLEVLLGASDPRAPRTALGGAAVQKPVFATPEEVAIAKTAVEVIRTLENKPDLVPSVEHLRKPEVQAAIVEAVQRRHPAQQLTLEGMAEGADIAEVVARASNLVIDQTINIPRILVVPRGEVKSGFNAFTLDLQAMRYPPVSEELWIQYLRTGESKLVAVASGGVTENRLEDYVVAGLVDFDDVSYDHQADLLYELAGQVVRHLRTYLDEAETRRVLRCYQRPIAAHVHSEMLKHRWEEAVGYDVRVSKSFTKLKDSAYTQVADEAVLDYRVSPQDKTNMARYLFGGFSRCLYRVQKFASDSERRMAEILERESLKWFKPAKGQFQIYYPEGNDHPEYQPDFVAETPDVIYMLEPKASNEMTGPSVLAKKEAARQWCERATTHAKTYDGKPWQYALIPHDAIRSNMTLRGLVDQYGE